MLWIVAPLIFAGIHSNDYSLLFKSNTANATAASWICYRFTIINLFHVAFVQSTRRIYENSHTQSVVHADICILVDVHEYSCMHNFFCAWIYVCISHPTSFILMHLKVWSRFIFFIFELIALTFAYWVLKMLLFSNLMCSLQSYEALIYNCLHLICILCNNFSCSTGLAIFSCMPTTLSSGVALTQVC